MTTSYGHDQDAEPPTPDGQEPEAIEADDAATDDAATDDDQDAEAPEARQRSEPPD